MTTDQRLLLLGYVVGMTKGEEWYTSDIVDTYNTLYELITK